MKGKKSRQLFSHLSTIDKDCDFSVLHSRSKRVIQVLIGLPYVDVTDSETDSEDNQSSILDLSSAYVSTQPVCKVKRWDEKEKVMVDVLCPSIENEYHKYKGGELI
ncbi:hypothetical protein T11_10010 [Trichinella zimbabwensis]|uniref:PiggyBac transposable element-derived protein domain-containing protein n=1 Tax=Trichinella zimbabwensis TaxID=268475 RepID=A0A0V1I5R2_9BILA|nr:hypothetical protein T11_10010 [Trichinella zimbabwensis]